MQRPVWFSAVAGFVFFMTTAVSAAEIPAFPGAEGFGSTTPGGRGGRVITVTNLNDDGPGSLRAACTAAGPRMVVFDVSGTIRLKKALSITQPNITIAGQTAPGAGVCLRDAVVRVQTHDVVIRFIRVRVGPSLNEKYNDQNCIEVSGEGAYNIVIDHCSFSWSIDEDVGIVSGAHDVTFSYNIVSEALKQPFTKTKIGKERSHSMAMILGNYPNHCSVHHNLLADCNSRMPRIQGGTHDFVNNVVYDWGFLSATFSREPNVNFIGNYYKRGPSSLPIKAIVDEGHDQGKIYVKRNRSPERPNDSLPEWAPLTNLDPALHQALQPFETQPITTTNAERAYSDVLALAGCRLPQMDDVDSRIIRQVYMGNGSKIDRPEEVGGYPDLPIVRGPKDSDRDGMPDDYESAHGLDPNNSRDGAERTKSGYTNLENYINSIWEKWMSEAAKVIVYPVPDPVKDSPYVVEANGVRIPVEKAGAVKGAYYARFEFTKKVRVNVAIKGAAKADVQLKPEVFRDNLKSDADRVSFDVSQAGPRVLTVKADGEELWPLIVIADDCEASSTPEQGSAVFNVKDYITSSGIQTANIQRALDECASREGGGTVVFGPGVYPTGTLRVKDNTTVYLAPGSLILGSENPADYPKDAKAGGSDSIHLILFDHCRNSRLTGRGVIDGSGHIIRNKYEMHVHLLDVTGCRNVRIDDAVLRNSSAWTLHILDSKGVRINNVKIIDDWGVGNTDGIDPDCSRDVYITRYFGYCGDDAVAIKTTGRSGRGCDPTVNVQVEDSIVMTRKTAFKVGTETRADIRDVVFRNCEAVNSSRGIGLWMRDGSTISDVTFRDVKLDLGRMPGEALSGEPMRAVVQNRSGVGKIKDVLFDRVSSTSPCGSFFDGLPESKLEDFNLWGCRFGLKARGDELGKSPVVSINDAKGFTFRFTYLNWPDNRDNWDGFIGQRNSEDIVVREMEEAGGRSDQ